MFQHRFFLWLIIINVFLIITSSITTDIKRNILKSFRQFHARVFQTVISQNAAPPMRQHAHKLNYQQNQIKQQKREAQRVLFTVLARITTEPVQASLVVRRTWSRGSIRVPRLYLYLYMYFCTCMYFCTQ